MNDQLTHEIVNGVAERRDVEPAELDLVIEDYIDTEAVERLADHETASWTLSFQLPESVVTIMNGGEISIDPLGYGVPDTFNA